MALLSAFRRKELLSNDAIFNGNVLTLFHISNFIPALNTSNGIGWTEIELT